MIAFRNAAAFRLLAATASSFPAAAVAQSSAIDGDVENAVCAESTLDLVWDFLTGLYSPDTSNPTGLSPAPRTQVFVPQAERAGLGTRRIVMFGDLHGMDDDTPPWVSAELRAIFEGADLILGNIESPITDNDGKLDLSSSQFFNFHANVAFLQSAMTQFCMDPSKTVFTVANNHTDDGGRWNETLSTYPEPGVRGVVGIDFDASRSEPEIQLHDLGALRVGVVGWTHVQNNAPETDASGSIVYPTWEASRRVTDRADWQARKEALGIDLLVGMPHWDCQFHLFPQPYTRAVATELHARGFDLIAGAHQSQLQPAEAFGAAHDMTFYGLGTLASGLMASENWLVPVVEMIVDENGRTLEYTMHPFVRHPDSTWVRSVSRCAGRYVYDVPRLTDWKIIPLDDLLDGSSGDRTDHAQFVEMLDAVFPP